MSTLSDSLESPTIAISNARQLDWSAYRKRARSAGRDYLRAGEGIVGGVRSGRGTSEGRGRV